MRPDNTEAGFTLHELMVLIVFGCLAIGALTVEGYMVWLIIQALQKYIGS